MVSDMKWKSLRDNVCSPNKYLRRRLHPRKNTATAKTNKRQKTYAHRKPLPLPPPSLIVCPLDDHLQIRIAFRDEMAEWLKFPAPNWGSFAVLEGFNFIINCKLSFVDFWGCSQSHLLKMMSLFVSVLP